MLYPPIAAVIPPAIAATLPPRDLLRQVLSSHIVDIPAGRTVVRAAWNPTSIWPASVTRTYRYGPHSSLKTIIGYPFYWIYTAERPLTAVWEAQFCGNPATLPGRFVVQHGAENGLIASLSFSQPLHLFDLSGAAASKLGIYDQLHSTDHEWCQWLGFELDQILAEYNGNIHGFAYPSRRHPGAPAYAMSSRVRDALGLDISINAQRFVDTKEYTELLADPCYIGRDWL